MFEKEWEHPDLKIIDQKLEIDTNVTFSKTGNGYQCNIFRKSVSKTPNLRA